MPTAPTRHIATGTQTGQMPTGHTPDISGVFPLYGQVYSLPQKRAFINLGSVHQFETFINHNTDYSRHYNAYAINIKYLVNIDNCANIVESEARALKASSRRARKASSACLYDNCRQTTHKIHKNGRNLRIKTNLLIASEAQRRPSTCIYGNHR